MPAIPTLTAFSPITREPDDDRHLRCRVHPGIRRARRTGVAAWSDPDYVTQWWGPAGFTSPSAELNFRIGGSSLVCMRAPAEFGGQDMYTTWTYRRIEPMNLIEFDVRFTDATGASIPPPPGVPCEVRHIVTFTSVAAVQTSMTVTEFGYPDEQVRDQSKAGLEQCLDKMAELLRKAAAHS